MYIAMNRFRIALSHEGDFINIWKNRDTHLNEVPGFKQFTLISSHSVWEPEQAFVNWTQREAFRKAHAQAGDSKGIYLGPPQFEGFTAVL